MNKIIKYVIFGILVLVLSLFLIKILSPAYFSYKLDCNPEFYEENIEFVGGYTDTETGEIMICVNESSKEYKRTLLHENCHLNQLKENRSYSCENPIGVFINEAECYIKEFFP